MALELGSLMTGLSTGQEGLSTRVEWASAGKAETWNTTCGRLILSACDGTSLPDLRKNGVMIVELDPSRSCWEWQGHLHFFLIYPDPSDHRRAILEG